MTFFDEGRKGATFDDGIELRCGCCWRARSSWCAPSASPPTSRAGQTYRITDLELASRLSFFLWSSIPDDELITVGQRRGGCSQPAVLEQQVRRMLADPRSDALVSNFAQQLLYLRNLPATSPDGIFYPNWDDELRQSLQARVGAVLREHHPRGPQHRRSADRRLHVRQRAAGAALRHSERLRRRASGA